MRTTLLFASLLTLATTACVSKSEYDRQLANAAALSAEKDSLLNEVVSTSQFIAQVNSEIDKVRDGKPVAADGGEMETLSPTEARKRLGERVQSLTERVRESEERLQQSRRRVTQLGRSSATQSAQMAAFDSTLKQFQIIMDNQKGEIVALLDQVGALTSENMALRETNTQLASERATLAADKEALSMEQNTVYWVAGEKDDLIRRGIVEQRGGMLGIGKTQVLARTLDASEFTAIDRRQTTEIALPDPSKTYRLISSNDLSGLDSTSAARGGRFKGSIHIAAPEVFWRTSKFLVLIEQ